MARSIEPSGQDTPAHDPEATLLHELSAHPDGRRVRRRPGRRLPEVRPESVRSPDVGRDGHDPVLSAFGKRAGQPA